jgi:hypothetical protein
MTPSFEASFNTVAVNPSPVPTIMLLEFGETDTEIDSAGAIVNTAEDDWLASVTEFAVSVTDVFAGMVGGGVYVVEPELGVFTGATDPHIGEQGVPPWVRDH